MVTNPYLNNKHIILMASHIDVLFSKCFFTRICKFSMIFIFIVMIIILLIPSICWWNGIFDKQEFVHGNFTHSCMKKSSLSVKRENAFQISPESLNDEAFRGLRYDFFEETDFEKELNEIYFARSYSSSRWNLLHPRQHFKIACMRVSTEFNLLYALIQANSPVPAKPSNKLEAHGSNVLQCE